MTDDAACSCTQLSDCQKVPGCKAQRALAQGPTHRLADTPRTHEALLEDLLAEVARQDAHDLPPPGVSWPEEALLHSAAGAIRALRHQRERLSLIAGAEPGGDQP